jgi:hypothetical protein
MHATLAAGNALAFEYSRQLRAVNGFTEKLMKEVIPAREKELLATKTELKKVQDELEKIRKSSRSSASGIVTPAHRGVEVDSGYKPGVRSEEALDAIAARMMAGAA